MISDSINIIIVFLFLLFIGFLIGVIFIISLNKHLNNTLSCSEKSPDFIKIKYRTWVKAFMVWCFVYYFVNIVSIIASLGVLVFLTKENIDGFDRTFIIIFSFISILFMNITLFLKPKKYQLKFYKAYSILEEIMFKYEKGMINEDELIEKYIIAENHSSPDD